MRPCKTIQRPALRRLEATLGDRLQIVEINAQEQPDLARQWGVLSVPTTFLLDSQGKTRHVNYGVTPTEKLLAQLRKEKIIS
jgi:thioredoxin 1